MNRKIRRRNLLPWWMKIFVWIFMFFGATSIATLFFNKYLFRFTWISKEKSVYGLQTFDTYSVLGLLISAILIFKAITAYSMWMEKNWAIKLGIIDASLGIIICSYVMFINPFFIDTNASFLMNIRLEFILLIPYLIKCLKLRNRWENIEFEKFSKVQIIENNEEIHYPIQKNNSIETVVEKEPKKEDDLDNEDHRRFMPN